MIKILWGEDDFRRNQFLKKIKGDFFSKTQALGEWIEIDMFDSKSAISLNEALVSQGLFSREKALIIRHFFSSKKKEADESKVKESAFVIENDLIDKIIAFSEKNQGQVFFVEDKKSNSSFMKRIAKHSEALDFSLLNGMALEKWVKEYLIDIDFKNGIEPLAVRELIAIIGNDTWRLANELNKLSQTSYGQLISAKLIKETVRGNVADSVFNLLDALASGNKKVALMILEKELKRGEAPLYFFSMVVYQFRNVLQVADLSRRGLSVDSIQKETRLHPFVVQKSLNQARRFSMERIRMIYAELGELDIQMKTGKVDPRLALEKFFVEI